MTDMSVRNLVAALKTGSETVLGKSELGLLFAKAGYDKEGKGPAWRDVIVLPDADGAGPLLRPEEPGFPESAFDGNWRAFRGCILEACRLTPVVRELAALDTPAANLATRCWIWSFMCAAAATKGCGPFPAEPAKVDPGEIDRIIPGFVGFDFENADSFAREMDGVPTDALPERVEALLALPGADDAVKTMNDDFRPILHGVSIRPEADGFLLSESVDFDGGFSDDHVAVLSEITPEAVSVAFHAKDGDRPTM